MTLRRSLIGGAAVVAGLVAPSAALGALPARTWVSGVGDDANPCSRTAPCKTFAGAIAKTATGGEINVLDPGGFGVVTITKAITISAVGVTAGVQAGGTNGIVINTSTDTSPGDPDRDVVTLKGLTIDGQGPAAGPTQGLSGIVIGHAGTVRLEDDEIYGFADDGVSFDPSAPTEAGAATPTLVVENSRIHDNTQDGVVAVPPPGGSLRVLVSGSSIDGNGCGLAAGLEFAAFSDATCGTGPSGSGIVTLDSAHTTVFGNAGVGVQSDGARASDTIAGDVVDGNAIGLEEFGHSTITAVGTNYVFDNTANGIPTSSVLGESGTVGLVCKTVTHTKTVTKRIHGHKRRVKVKVPEQVCTGTIGP